MQKKNYRKKYHSLLFIVYYLLFTLLNLSCEIISGPEVEEYEFDLPSVHIYIDSEDLGILNSNVYSNRCIPARLVYNDHEYGVHLRHHGHLSRHFLKKSYKIKFKDTDLFEDRKKVVLSSQWTDKSLLRSRLSFYLFQKAGLRTSDNRFITLFINNDYIGIYYLIEPVDEFFLLNRGMEVGNLYKSKGHSRFTFEGGYDVRVGFKKKPIDDGNYSDLEYLINILDTVPTDKLMSQIEKVLDVENYLNYLAVSVLITNWDGFFKNFYLHNENFGRFKIIPWDLDLTFRNSTRSIYGQNNLSKRLLQVEAYRTYYKNRLRELMDSEFSDEVMFPMIDQLSNYIEEAYENDPFIRAKGCSLDKEAKAVKNFIQSRRSYLEEQLKDL